MIARQKLSLYAYNIEPLRNESQAIIWGKTMVFDTRAEIASGVINPEVNQFQNVCVMLKGLER